MAKSPLGGVGGLLDGPRAIGTWSADTVDFPGRACDPLHPCATLGASWEVLEAACTTSTDSRRARSWSTQEADLGAEIFENLINHEFPKRFVHYEN